MEASVEILWQSLNPQLSQFIRTRVPDSATADDLLQDVYIKLHTHLSDVRDSRRLHAWVFQIARNTIRDYYRSQSPQLMDADDELIERVPVQDADDADDPMFRLAAGLKRMIDCLPQTYRDALLMAEIEGMPLKEVARRLDLSLSGAKTRVMRARRMLREALLACCHFEFDRSGRVLNYAPRCHCCADGGCVQSVPETQLLMPS
jgi:RNA polymerase sigma-70 factor, ECF subfamily